MSPPRGSSEVRDRVRTEPALTSDAPAVGGWLQRVCRVAERELPASGVGVCLLTEDGEPITAAASGCGIVLEELQRSLGEGPGLSAFTSRRLVLVPDLGRTGPTRWPGFAPAAHSHGVLAVFAFPLQAGAARVGSLDVFRGAVGALPERTLALALLFAELALEGLLDVGSTPAGAAELFGDDLGVRYEVYQAQGMVMVQLHVGAEEAMARLRGHAFAQGQPLTDVAHDVISRRLVLERDGP